MRTRSESVAKQKQPSSQVTSGGDATPTQMLDSNQQHNMYVHTLPGTHTHTYLHNNEQPMPCALSHNRSRHATLMRLGAPCMLWKDLLVPSWGIPATRLLWHTYDDKQSLDTYCRQSYRLTLPLRRRFAIFMMDAKICTAAIVFVNGHVSIKWRCTARALPMRQWLSSRSSRAFWRPLRKL